MAPPAPGGGRLPSPHPIFANDFYYISSPLAAIVGTAMVGVGIALTTIDIVTTHAGAYNFMLGVSSVHNAALRSNQQLYHDIGWTFALIPPLLFFLMLFQIGRHYPTHTAHQTHESLGMGKSVLSSGLHFTGYLFAQMIHGLPFVMMLFSLGTTAFGFWNLWQPDDAGKALSALVGSLVAAAVVYAFGPTFIVVSFHLWREAALDRMRYRKARAAILGGASSARAVPAPSGPPPAAPKP